MLNGWVFNILDKQIVVFLELLLTNYIKHARLNALVGAALLLQLVLNSALYPKNLELHIQRWNLQFCKICFLQSRLMRNEPSHQKVCKAYSQVDVGWVLVYPDYVHIIHVQYQSSQVLVYFVNFEDLIKHLIALWVLSVFNRTLDLFALNFVNF